MLRASRFPAFRRIAPHFRLFYGSKGNQKSRNMQLFSFFAILQRSIPFGLIADSADYLRLSRAARAAALAGEDRSCSPRRLRPAICKTKTTISLKKFFTLSFFVSMVAPEIFRLGKNCK